MKQPVTSEEYFKLALREEEILKSLQINDPYKRIARSNVDYYLEQAVALEKAF